MGMRWPASSDSDQWNAYAFMDEDSCEKRHKSYVKRQERAEAKRRLLKWRCLKISPEELGEMPECKQSRFSNLQHPGWSFRMEKETRQFKKKMRGQQGSKEDSTSSFGRKSSCDWSSTTSQSTEYSSWRFEKSTGGEWWRTIFGEANTGKRRATSDWGRTGNDNSFPETIGSPSDRKTLGLSPFGPLTLKDLKHAFRACALKWHPDRHEGSSKAIAEEQFKSCGAAYKALYATLSP
ncbi:hypothetical protein O6H91_21G041200 [Diphasiastrum complanatum]|uniref:Uncharacterized protein n=1 Tax=Diphasiastrum complanatum TaxID=34168 RepID=A0ACC2AJR4_DIPCM|nr:hypothetical protein O6H91_21G041200 [Diphasiastrum complanatum]